MNKYPVLTLIVIFIFNCTLFCRCENGNRSNGHNHEYVDLGLPSGTLWAKCNIGANNPEDDGDCFAWGEVTNKNDYNWNTYKYSRGSENKIVKYCEDSDLGYNGFSDNLSVLEASDDVASVNWKSNWKIPGILEIEELIRECTIIHDTINGKLGLKVIGPNSNSIFLPVSTVKGIDVDSTNTVYWLNSGLGVDACAFHFNSYNYGLVRCPRFCGLCIRPVCNPNVIKKRDIKGTHNGHEWIDLGLPSGTLWATCNIGASKSEDYGNYFAWGEKKAKSFFAPGNYFYNKTKPIILPRNADAAAVNWGGVWRTPTKTEFEELTECKWTWIKSGNTYGYKLTGPNGNSIFLPAAGFHMSDTLVGANEIGSYWSSSLMTNAMIESISIAFDSNKQYFYPEFQFMGLPIRAICTTKDLLLWESGNINISSNKSLDIESYPWDTPVDLGLTSGTKWAICNVGATTPEEQGYYYAWGEKLDWSRDWDNYTHCNGNFDKLTKYCSDSMWGNNGYTDTLTVLEPNDDAATVNWGRKWKTPTLNDFQELIDECTWVFTKLNGSNGYKIIGNNGNSIFLPATGMVIEGMPLLRGDESNGEYWTSSLCLQFPFLACKLDFDRSKFDITHAKFRIWGGVVRPIYMSGDNSNKIGEQVSNKIENKQNKGNEKMLNGHEWVDLGLSVKWATCNVGASKPKDFGNYYAWGETQTKSTYSYESYAFPKIEVTQLPARADAATVNWGSGWRMPTNAELEELQKRCNWEWKGDGYKVTGPNGNSIFLPAAGYRMDDKLNGSNSVGYYWSSSACNTWPRSVPYAAWYLFFGDGWTEMVNFVRDTGCSIRPVCTK